MILFSFIRAKHNLIFKIFLVLSVSFLLALLIPQKKIKAYKVNNFTAIWPYADLIIEHDILVEKKAEEINAQKQEIIAKAPLFFELNNGERDLKQKKLTELKNQNPSDYELINNALVKLYSKGIIEQSDSLFNRLICISNGNFFDYVDYKAFYTLASADQFLQDSVKTKSLKVIPTDFLAINYFFNKEKTNNYLQSQIRNVSVIEYKLNKGEVLVKQNEALTKNKRDLINIYFQNQEASQLFSGLKFLAIWLLLLIIGTVLLVFLAFFRKSIFGQNRQVAFLFFILFVSVFATSVFFKFGLMIYALPFALIPILVRVFFDGRTALFTHLITVLICSFYFPDRLQFILLELLSGIGTLFAVAEMRKRNQILNGAIYVLVFYVLIFFTYQIGFESQYLAFKWSSYVPFCISSLLVLLAYPLIYIIENFFGFISDFKLLELCDLNQPLLRKLSKEVPGTFQHSLQVANLAEEAIYHIGGNSLLIRAGAMYHDIGKMYQPNFFTENQSNGFSPHQEINPIESAKIIINHVIKGIELAKEYKLPEQVIDFIRTHHGTTAVRYFYTLFEKMEGEDAKLSEAQFHYPGPIPFSKETAVLMIADGVEAASRSLKTHDGNSINNLVDKIVDYKISTNQFINSDITFKDLTTIKRIFKKRLLNIYHARIEYPD